MIALCIPTPDFGDHTLTFVSGNSTSSVLFAAIAPAVVRARIAQAIVLADAAPSILLARIAQAAVWADPASAAFLARIAQAIVWTAISDKRS